MTTARVVTTILGFAGRSIECRVLAIAVVMMLHRIWVVSRCGTFVRAGTIFSFSRAGWSVSMVAFGDRNDFLQVLRMWHFRRKCHMRNTCKRDAGRGRACACTGLLFPQFVMSSRKETRVR